MFEAEVSRNLKEQAHHFDALWKRDGWTMPEYIPKDRRHELLGSVAGLRILDIGSGVGEWAVHLAQIGAHVVATDVSTESMRQVRAGALRFGVSDRVETAVVDAHRLPFADHTFDVVHGQFILHHLDLARAGPELVRVLRPGGIGVFLENSAKNPLLMLARRELVGRFGIARWSVDGEYPLRRADVELLKKQFGQGSIHYFEFQCFSILDEKIFKGRCVFGGLDPWIYRLFPALRPYGYIQWLRFQRQAPAMPSKS